MKNHRHESEPHRFVKVAVKKHQLATGKSFGWSPNCDDFVIYLITWDNVLMTKE